MSEKITKNETNNSKHTTQLILLLIAYQGKRLSKKNISFSSRCGNKSEEEMDEGRDTWKLRRWFRRTTRKNKTQEKNKNKIKNKKKTSTIFVFLLGNYQTMESSEKAHKTLSRALHIISFHPAWLLRLTALSTSTFLSCVFFT